MFCFAALCAAYTEIFKKQIKPTYWAFCFMLMVIIGFRHTVGGDWYNYLDMFSQISSLDFSQAIFVTDPAYGVINWLADRTGREIYTINTICAVIFCYGLFRYSNTLPKPWIALCVAIPYMVTAVAMGYTRQAAAIGFIFLSLVAIQKNRNLKFLYLIICAALFHKSAIFFLLLLFSHRNKITTHIKIITLTIFALLIVATPYIEHIQMLYLSGDVESDGARLRAGMNFVPAVIFFIYKKEWQERWPESYRSTFILAAISMAMLPISFFHSTLADRLALYISPIQLSVYSSLPLLFKHSYRGAIMIAIILQYFTIYIVWLSKSPWAQCCWIPYSSSLFL